MFLRSLSLFLFCASALNAQRRLLLPGEMPRMCGVDTRYTSTEIEWEQAAWLMANALFDKYAPSEAGVCLYGGFERVPGGHVLVITTAIEGRIITATPDSVRFSCTRDPAWLGTLHIHTDSTAICAPSRRNFQLLLWGDATVEYILCPGGVGYFQLRDGRWDWMIGREP